MEGHPRADEQGVWDTEEQPSHFRFKHRLDTGQPYRAIWVACQRDSSTSLLSRDRDHFHRVFDAE